MKIHLFPLIVEFVVRSICAKRKIEHLSKLPVYHIPKDKVRVAAKYLQKDEICAMITN